MREIDTDDWFVNRRRRTTPIRGDVNLVNFGSEEYEPMRFPPKLPDLSVRATDTGLQVGDTTLRITYSGGTYQVFDGGESISRKFGRLAEAVDHSRWLVGYWTRASA